jgi:hypothetical protein
MPKRILPAIRDFVQILVDGWGKPGVSEDDGVRSLHFNSGVVQSSMRVSAPFELNLGQFAKPLAARLDLVLRFLAGAVQHRSDRPRHVGGSLQQQRGLADPGLAAQQDQRAGHDAAAEDAIELVDARRKPGVLLDFDLGIQARRCRGASERVAMTRRRPRIARGRRSLLDKRIPRAAVRTAAEPLGGL